MYLKVISGGQTGVDRGALDAALDKLLPCGGYCPKGRKAEDGVIPPEYPLDELPISNYPSRTRANVAAASAVLVLVFRMEEFPSPGTLLTLNECRRQGKPYLVAVIGEPEVWEDALLAAVAFVRAVPKGGVLMVAGPRESKSPGIQELTRRFVCAVLDRIDAPGATGEELP